MDSFLRAGFRRNAMPVIKPTCVRDLKQRIVLGDVVSRMVTLRSAGGGRMKGLCPFHNEKTPSFNVDSDKGYYKCFGCGKAGDAITFVRETEMLSFTEAVEALGARFGIPIEYEAGGGPTTEERSLRQELFDLHDQAAAHYHEVFKAAGPAGDFMRAYWTQARRFPAELADEFLVGAAPARDPGLGARLMKRGYSEEAIRRSGLFFNREGAALTLGALMPRFRGRLMIPIRDHQGRVVAFTARQTELTPQDDPAKEAKYVNSPETPIFSKGGLLFNLDRARTAVGEGRPFVLVEGQLDALRCWQVGLKTAVAPQGTSLTENQLVLLRRYHPVIECLFDSDAAGQKASLRMLPLALKAGMEVRFLGLKGDAKVDPDLLFLERGLEAYAELRASSVGAMAYACRAMLPEGPSASLEQRMRVAQAILEFVNGVTSETARAGFVDEVSLLLRLSRRDLPADLARLAARDAQRKPLEENVVEKRVMGVSPEQDLLRLCLHFEELGPRLSQATPHDWVDVSHVAGRLLNRLLGEFEQGSWPGRDHLETLLETPEEKALVASILFENQKIETPLKVAGEGLRQLRARALEPRLHQIELALANAGADSKIDPNSLLRERSVLQRQLREKIPLADEGGAFSS